MSVLCSAPLLLPVFDKLSAPKVQLRFGRHGYSVPEWVHISPCILMKMWRWKIFCPQFKIPVYVTSSHESESLYTKDLTQSCVWILGNEGQGVSEYALAHAQAVSITPARRTGIPECCYCRFNLFLRNGSSTFIN